MKYLVTTISLFLTKCPSLHGFAEQRMGAASIGGRDLRQHLQHLYQILQSVF